MTTTRPPAGRDASRVNGPSRPSGRGQRGASLLEALIGFAVVTVGLIGTAQWQQRLRQAADHARQQAHALHAAQEELDALRTLARRGEPAAGPGSTAAPAPRLVPAPTGSHSDLQVSRRVQAASASAAQTFSAEVQVEWQDTRGRPQRLSLSTLLADEAPAAVLALAQPPDGRQAAPRLGRHAAIPAQAVERPDGHFVFKPVHDGPAAWLMDRRSGHIVGVCTGAAAAMTDEALASAPLGDCTPAKAWLLSGEVRHAPGPKPEAATGSSRTTPWASPPPLAVDLWLDSRGHAAPPTCLGEPVRLWAGVDPTRPRSRTVPEALADAAANPAWADTGERWWQFHCAVPLAPPPRTGVASRWTGRLQFSPIGWTIGTVPGSRRLCRYSADTDGSGAIDRPAEAPATLVDVDDALTGQRFLLIDGEQPCPAAARPSAVAGGHLPWSQANPATVPHQP